MVPDNKSWPSDTRSPAGAEVRLPQAEPALLMPAAQPLGRLWWLLAAVMALGVGLRGWLSASTDFSIGDAYIIFRFAEQFAAGNGLVFNAGEWVGGNTSPLHTLLLGLGAYTGAGVPLVARLLGIACDVAALYVLWQIFRAPGGISSPLLQVVTLAVVFLSPFLFFYSVSGMETPLYVLLIFFVLDRTLRGFDWLWCLAVALLFFCRPDGVVAVGAALLFLLLTARKIPWSALLSTVVIGLAYLAFNYLLYGVVIPPTVKVKAVAYHNSPAALFQYIADRFFFHRAWLLAAYLALMFVLLVVRWRHRVVLLLGLAAIGYLVFDLTAPYLRTWYVVPFLTLSACTILVAAASLAEGLPALRVRPLVVGGLALYLLVSAVAYRAVFAECRGWRERIRALTEAAGFWVRDNTPPDAKVFVTALEIGYFSKRHTWDAPGLVAPQVLKLIQAHPDMELLELADRVQADYAVVPDQFQRSGHPNFRRLQAFGTAKSTAHIGLGESSYSIYQRLNSAVEPGPK